MGLSRGRGGSFGARELWGTFRVGSEAYLEGEDGGPFLAYPGRFEALFWCIYMGAYSGCICHFESRIWILNLYRKCLAQ